MPISIETLKSSCFQELMVIGKLKLFYLPIVLPDQPKDSQMDQVTALIAKGVNAKAVTSL